MAVERVKTRVRMGGHDVPEEIIRRRYVTGLRNFFELYQPIATTWQVYDNAGGFAPMLVAEGETPSVPRVIDAPKWNAFKRGAGHET